MCFTMQKQKHIGVMKFGQDHVIKLYKFMIEFVNPNEKDIFA